MKVVISGSFRKHMSEILKLVKQFTEDGIEVLKPSLEEIIDNPADPEFIKFKGEENKSPMELEVEYLEAIDHADAHVICDVGGYIGEMGGCEASYGAGLRTPVYLTDPIIRVSASNVQEEAKLRAWYEALIKVGLIKIGVDTMYRDFELNKEHKK